MVEFKDVSENSLSGYFYIIFHVSYWKMHKWRINVFDACTASRLWIYFLLYRAIIVGSINQEYQIYEPSQTVPKHSGQATQMYHSRG